MKAVAERTDNKVTLQIEVDATEVDAALDRAYRKIVKNVNIPGFRKGKVPRAILEKRFGKEVLYEDALDELIPVAYEKAVETNEIEPIDQPQLTDVDISAGEPLKLTMVVDVVPEVKLGEYKGLEVEKLVERVDSDDIDHMLEHMQEDRGELASTDRDIVEHGDFVQLDFEGFIDGVPFQGGAAKGETLEIGSGQFIPGFEDQLIGVKIGEDVELEVTFPENYGNELAGKDAVFKVKVESIKIRVLPDLTDEFAEEVSEGKAKTMLDLRAQIRTDMESDADARADGEMRSKLIDLVTDASEVDIPEVMIERQIDQQLNDMKQELAMSGLTYESYLEMSEQTEEDIKEQLRPTATRRVKGLLVLNVIARDEGIVVSDDELQAEVKKLVEESRVPNYTEQLLEDPDRLDALRENMGRQRATDLLVQLAKVTEKEVESRGHGHDHDHDHDEEGHDHDDEGDNEDNDSVNDDEIAGETV